MCDLGQNKILITINTCPASELPLKTRMEFIDGISPFKPAIEFSAAEPLFVLRDKTADQPYKEEGPKCRIFTNDSCY